MIPDLLVLYMNIINQKKNNYEKENNTTFGNDANNIESVFPRMQRNDSKGYNNYKLCSE